jgi:outer membrane protein OmpA-like peptidoglycan-associated protein/tetratricopeptide (TPR) repeat protein
MKHNFKYLLLLSVCFSISVFGQTAALKKANKFFTTKAYSQAIPYYEKELKKDSSNKIILSNLGDCYRLTNNTNGQLLCYGGLIKSGKAESIHNLYYGQALTESGQKETAKSYFEKYNADSRGKNLASSVDKFKIYTKNADAYRVELASFNSPQNDFTAVKFQDAIVFASSRNKPQWINKKHGWTSDSYLKLYTTQNSGGGVYLKPKIFMGDLSSKYNDGPICFSKDYNTVYFTRNNSNKKFISSEKTYKLKIFEAGLNQNGFDRARELPFNGNNFNCAHPSLSNDGTLLFFASDMEGGFGGMDIYYTKKEGDVWGIPVNLGATVNTAGTEVFPFIAANGLLYFSSNGHDGLGGLDVYETKINNEKAGSVYNMGEPVNSTNDDFGVFLGEDNKIGYVSSNRKSGGMDDDIYNFEILREVKRGKEVLFITKDKYNGEILPNTKFTMNGNSFETNEKGEYATTVEEDVNYSLVVDKVDYFKLEDSVSTKTSTEDAFTKELKLEKDPKVSLLAFITDAKTNKALDGVKITINELPSKLEFDKYTTEATGEYRKPIKGKKIGNKLRYFISLEKDGYLTKTTTFVYEIKAPGEIKVNESINLSLGKVEVGMDLSKMIDMKPIYFDLGKSNIRWAASVELDKVVKVMTEYPNMYIQLGSHTDCRGAAAANAKLSSARAKSSADYIVKKGINKARIVGKGYGETKLLTGCNCEGNVKPICSEDEHAKNRRTEFVITKLK